MIAYILKAWTRTLPWINIFTPTTPNKCEELTISFELKLRGSSWRELDIVLYYLQALVILVVNDIVDLKSIFDCQNNLHDQ